MLRHRKILLAVTLVVAGGSFYSALGYAIWLHSDWHRAKKQRELIEFLELPAAIGEVQPLSYYRADFHDIRVWLLGRRSEIFHCDVAEMHEIPGSEGAFGLVIRNGRLTIDAASWARNDYGYVLRSGLGHDFAALKLRWVELYGVDLSWRQGPIALTLGSATGPIKFPSPDEGRISVVSHMINDTYTSEPINVVAKFRPARDLVVHELVLRVPTLPIKALRLDSLLGNGEASGQFEGRLSYHHNNDEPFVRIHGRAEGINLPEWTVQLDTGPVHGLIDLAIDHLELNEQGLTTARFSGRARDLQLAELARVIAVPPLEGAASLEVLNAELAGTRLVRLSVRGEVVDGSLEPIVTLLGPGKIAGTFRMKVNSLDLVDDEVVSADIDVEVVPPKDGPPTIDTQLLEIAAQKLMGIELSSLVRVTLKQLKTVNYTRFAFKLLADDGQLRILGTHGPGQQTILTIKALGAELPVVTQPDQPMALTPLITKLRARSRAKFLELMQRYQVTTQPSTP